MCKNVLLSWNQLLELSQPSNGHNSTQYTSKLSQTTTKWSTISITLQQHANQNNLVYIEFKMLKNKLCTLVWGLGERLLRKRHKLKSLSIRLWDREPSCLISHVLTSIYIEKYYSHIICESYINFISTMSLFLCETHHICIYYLHNMTFWGLGSVILTMSHSYYRGRF